MQTATSLFLSSLILLGLSAYFEGDRTKSPNLHPSDTSEWTLAAAQVQPGQERLPSQRGRKE